jgi:hypothetical protein
LYKLIKFQALFAKSPPKSFEWTSRITRYSLLTTVPFYGLENARAASKSGVSKPFSEPVMNRQQQIPNVGCSASSLPQSTEAKDCAKLKPLRLLAPGNFDCMIKTVLSSIKSFRRDLLLASTLRARVT